MKKLFFLFFGLLAANSASAINDASILRMDSVKTIGNYMAMMTQELEINAKNITNNIDYEGRWYVLAENQSTHNMTSCTDTLITIGPHEYASLRLKFRLPEGQFRLLVTTDAAGKVSIGEVKVTIKPFRKINFHASLSIDMLSTENGHNTLYDQKIRGSVKVLNNDITYLGAYAGTAAEDGIMLWLEKATEPQERVYSVRITDKLELGEAWKTFSYDEGLQYNQDYILKVGYATPEGWETIESLSFTTQPGANTYWTADGQVLPLPQDGNVLQIPAEAVAVDLRSQHITGTEYQIDASSANPNCLFYLDQQNALPTGLEETRNVIRNLQAENINVIDNNDFYCPQAFKAKFVSYLLKPTYDNPDSELNNMGYSETLVLPFNVSQAALYDVNGATEPLYADKIKVLRYYGNAGDTLNVSIVDVSQMMAYVPYILGVYVGSRVLFMGENTTVPMTRQAVDHGENFNFIGTTVAMSLTDVYQYSPVSNCFNRNEANQRIAPFRAYMYRVNSESEESPADGEKSSDYLFFRDEAWGAEGNPTGQPNTTAIQETACWQDNTRVAFSLSGIRFSTGSLPKGLYIIGGKKRIIR